MFGNMKGIKRRNMRKATTLFMVLAIAILTVAPVFALGEDVLIYPYRIPIDENGERIVTVQADQNILLGAGWGACTYGLVLAWTKTANVLYTVDDISLVTLKESRKLWYLEEITQPSSTEVYCVNNVKLNEEGEYTGMWAYWVYELGPLPPGDHLATLMYWNDKVPIDGGDYDEDGKPDNFKGWSSNIDFIIRVEE